MYNFIKNMKKIFCLQRGLNHGNINFLLNDIKECLRLTSKFVDNYLICIYLMIKIRNNEKCNRPHQRHFLYLSVLYTL